MHYQLPRRTDALLTRLIRLAGGDMNLVYAAIGQNHGAPVRLTDVIRHIETHRPAHKPT